jgi:hypothetical protein
MDPSAEGVPDNDHVFKGSLLGARFGLSFRGSGRRRLQANRRQLSVSRKNRAVILELISDVGLAYPGWQRRAFQVVYLSIQ